MASKIILLVGFLCWAVTVTASADWPSSANPFAGEEPTFVSTEGRDHPDCIGGGIEYPCHTLSYVADSLSCSGGGSSTITVLGEYLEVRRDVNFSSISDVVLEGSPTELKCICKNCGVIFENLQNLTIRSLYFSGCGAISHAGKNRMSAVVIGDSEDVVIENVSINSSIETGLFMTNTFGNVRINNCTFENSGTCSDCVGASGINIKFSKASNIGSNYTISDCFVRNNRDAGSITFKSGSLGGGIDLIFKGSSKRNTLVFEDIVIDGNNATWGGGMAIGFSDNATFNEVFVRRTDFRNNNATKAGGGIDIGYLDSTNNPPITNIVIVEESNFTGNKATYGAGVAIYAGHTTHLPDPGHDEEALVFKSCHWRGNEANFGSTVDISPFSYDTLSRLYSPRPIFIDCSFTSSAERFTASDLNFLINTGSFAVNGFEIQFQGTIHFYNHTVTPLHVTDGVINIMPGTIVEFNNNTGSQGGAIALYGASILRVFPNSTTMFINNSATGDGGAIYQSSQNHHDFISSRTCFIQNGSKEFTEDRPVLVFKDNRVGHNKQTGHAIYATTFFPCYFQQYSEPFWKNNITDMLQEIADFYFYGNDTEALASSQENDTMALASSGIYYKFDNNKPVPAFPGRAIMLDFSILDELNHTVPTVYRVLKNDQCLTDRQYMIKNITINSKEYGECNLSLLSVSFRELLLNVPILLQMCPPGFFMNDVTDNCECSTNFKNKSYSGISTCSTKNLVAYLNNGYWAGYVNNSLLTARCPSSFCNTAVHKDRNGIKLPNSSEHKDLEKVVCSKNRTGRLCGKCKSGTSTYFHSPTYQCGCQKKCALGPLFYLLSEVLPTVVMFSVIAIFDIRFTTGTASSLVFFAQITDTFTFRKKWDIEEPQAIQELSRIYRVIYGLFNFEFINIEAASFCLWKSATLLDIIAVKYVSVLFAFTLLLSIVLFLNYCSCNCLNRGNKLLTVGKNRSVVHSMSAFLVMCYAQCTNISFQILTMTKLRGPGTLPIHTVTSYGGVTYMSHDHLQYAVPACLCIMTIVAIPPLLLLVYPSYMHLLSLCNLNEKQPVRYVSRFFIKLKPFIDSFQGCYQDKMRFFSAFYFLGRVTILAVNAFVTSTTQSIVSMLIVILFLLGLYALCYPFQSKSDNTNTILVLLNMAMVALFSMLARAQYFYEEQKHAVVFSLTIRVILLYIPIVCVVGHLVVRLVYFVKSERGETSEESAPIEENVMQRVIDHSILPYQEISVESPTNLGTPQSNDVELSYSYTDREELLAYI